MLYRKHKMRDDWVFRRGDLYLANMNPFKGSEQSGTRPVLVLQNNAGNFYAPTLIVAPVTTRLYKQDLPTHLVIGKEGGLYERSMIELEQIRVLDKQRCMFYIGKLSRQTMEKVDEMIKNSLGLMITEDVEAP